MNTIQTQNLILKEIQYSKVQHRSTKYIKLEENEYQKIEEFDLVFPEQRLINPNKKTGTVKGYGIEQRKFPN